MVTICRHAHRGLFSHTFELRESLSDRIELLWLTLLCWGLLAGIGRGNVKYVIANVKLEISPRVNRLWAC